MDTGASRHEGPGSSQGVGPGAISRPLVGPGIPSTISPIRDVSKVGLSIQAGHNPPPGSPAVSAMTVSDYDIELDPLPPPAPGTYSTDQLVPKRIESNTETTNSVKTLAASSWPPPTPTPLRPNNKPIPLRWVYHILLLVLIAGFFAFLEYETRLLPEPGYHSFQPVPQRMQSHSQAKRDSAGETPSLVEPTQTTSKTSSARPGLITSPPRIRPRDPAPDPIPPESEYPKPNDGTDYCFWYPPRWRFQNLLVYYPMLEYIQFFPVSEDNPDLPLCPCHNVIYEEDNTTRVRVGSVDEYCDAVINVIKTVNALQDRQYSWWQGGHPYTTSFPWWRGPDRYWMTPPQMTVSPPWIYPSFAPNGDVFLPLEKRTTAPGPNGEAVSDVFGKRLESPYVGYFPAGHTGIETMWTYYGLVYHATDTITHPATRSILWWQLPLSRPGSLFTADLPTSMSAPASASPGIITTEDIPASASATPLPSSPSEPVVSTTPPASAQPSTPPESAVHSSTDSEVVVFPVPTSSSSDQGNKNPSTSNLEPNSSPKPLPVITSTAAQVSTSDNIIWTTNIIAITSLTTVGTSTMTNIVPVTSDGTTSFTTIITAVPLISTTTILSTQRTPTTLMTAYPPPPRRPTTSSSFVQLDTMLSAIPTQISTRTYFDDNGVPTETFTGTFMTYTTFIDLFSTTEARTMTLEYIRPRPGSPPDDLHGPHSWNPNGGPFEPDKHKFFSLNSEKDFLMASLIPVLLATFLAIPIQIFIKTFNHMLPFRALRHRGRREARSEGADAQDSLCLSRGSMTIFTSPRISFRFIRKYQDPLPLLSFVLDIFTTLLIPLASETIQIEFGQNWCTSLDWPVVPFGYRGPCAIGLRKSVLPSRAAEVFLCIMSAIILVMGFVLWRWRTGVATDPWSVASMTALLSGSSEEVKGAILGITPPNTPQSGQQASDSVAEAATSKDIAKSLEGKRFRLGYFQVPSSSYDQWWSDDKQQGGESAKSDYHWSQRGPYQQQMSYGLQLVSPDQTETGSVRLTVKEPPTRASSTSSTQNTTTQHLSVAGKLFAKTKRSIRTILPSKRNNTSGASKNGTGTPNLLPVVFLVLVTGLLILILYYENTILDTPFERFMDSQTYGVRFLFTAMGTGITTFWDYYFGYICEKQHFSQLQAATPNPGHEDSERTLPQEQARELQEGQEEHGIEQRRNGNTARPQTEPPMNNTTGDITPDNLSPSTTITPDSPDTKASGTTALASPTSPTTSPTSSPANTTPSSRTTKTTTINTILSPIPPTEVHALYHAFSQRQAQPKDRLTLASVSLATFLSKFAPILLSGVPFRNTVTWKMHETYTWTLVFVLSYMVLVLGALLLPRAVPLSLLGRFRKTTEKARKNSGEKLMPAPPPPPTSIAGYMYYVCDSHMLRDFEGLSTAPRKARDKAVMEMNNTRGHEDDTSTAGGGRRYFMGTMTGVSGVRRVGIDYLSVSR